MVSNYISNSTCVTHCVHHYVKGMVTRDVLLDPTEAREILEDTEEECRGFGSLVRVLMPLPLPLPLPAGESEGQSDPPGVGEVLLHFADVASARRAQRSLNRRKFADRLVTAVFVSEAREGGGSNPRPHPRASSLIVVHFISHHMLIYIKEHVFNLIHLN